MRKKLPTQFFIYLLVLVSVVLVEYGPSFNFYFVGDDFEFIEFLLKEKAAILWKSSCFYHYNPLGLIISSLPACFGLFNPTWFVGVNFLFFVGCLALIMMVYRKTVGNLLGGFLAALIYATAIPNSEVIYWKTGNQTIAMAFFSLLALLLFMRYLEKGSWKTFLGCVAAFVASILCIEQGIVTFGVLFLYDLILWSWPRLRTPESDKKKIGFDFLRRQVILFSVPILFTVLKWALRLQLSPFSLTSRVWRMVPMIMLETAAKLFDFNNIVFSLARSQFTFVLILFIMLASFGAYILIRRSSAGLFFFLTGLGSILTISFAAGGPNSRYFCLPLAFYACFLSLFFADLIRFAVRTFDEALARISDTSKMPQAGWFYTVLYFGVFLTIAYVGFRGNIERRSYWEAASRIQKNMVEYVENLYLSGTLGGAQKLYLLNIPESVWSKEHSVFYVASNSLLPDLRHRLGEAAAGIELIATGASFEMDMRGERVMYRALGLQNKVERKDIENLTKNGQVVLWFSPSTQKLAPLSQLP